MEICEVETRVSVGKFTIIVFPRVFVFGVLQQIGKYLTALFSFLARTNPPKPDTDDWGNRTNDVVMAVIYVSGRQNLCQKEVNSFFSYFSFFFGV